jgi:dTDP-4-dehydrorhamnose reductase
MGGLSRTPPQVWAGVECSYLTVRDWTCDQLVLTGHDERDDDLDRLSELGVSALRYPVIWGRDRGTGEATDWAWAESRLDAIAGHGIEPVIGLVHHGFGPASADPLDDAWPTAFAAYARDVAGRAPAGASYLPINEPLTTARFSGLYGWWPPYARSDEVFVELILAQARGFRDAARAIREVRPSSRIVINEDIGRTWGTERCRALIDHAMERRWLTFDLATGRVDRGHPLWRYLARTARHRRILDSLRSEPEPPDLLGIDYYVTSDRYLDHRTEIFPASTHGTAGGLRFADVEAARVEGCRIDGWRELPSETWERYELPVALTEVQLAGDPDDQVAWWSEAWNGATAAAEAGVPVAGVTAWSAFGSFEWASVLCRPRGVYESGCFDLASGEPVATQLAAAVATTARTGRAVGPTGWWRRDDRVLFRRSARAEVAA